MNCKFVETTKVQRAEDVFVAEVEAELVLMHVASGRYYGLDGIGTAVWQLLEHEMQLADLYASLAQRYDADIPTIERDVRPWLKQLTAEKLIEIRN